METGIIPAIAEMGDLPVWLDILIELIKAIIDEITSNFPVLGPIVELIKFIIDIILKLIFGSLGTLALAEA